MSLLRFVLIGLALARLGCSGTLHASVVEDHSGHPVVSAELQISRRGVAQLVADLESDADGRFEPLEIADGDYLLTVSKSNYLETSLRLRSESLRQPLEIRLVRCGTVSGRVLDPNGAPLANAYVFAIGGSKKWDTVTHANGEYRIAGLTSGEYSVAANYGQPTLAVGQTGNPPVLGPAGAGAVFYPEKLSVVSGEDHVHIDFSLTTSALYRVSGKIDAPESSDRNYWVALAPSDHADMATSVAIAGPDNSFHFEGIRPASYDLFVSGPSNSRSGYGAHLGEHPQFGRTQVEVTAQDIEGLHVKVGPALTLQVLVRAGEDCSPNARVTLTPMEDWAAFLHPSGQSGDDGTVMLAGLPPGRFRVSGESDRCFQARDVVADLSGSNASRVQIDLTRGAVIKVQVHPVLPVVLLTVAGLSAGKTRTAIPDEQGHLEFSGLPPGRYRLKALAGTRINLTDLDLQPGEIRKVEVHLNQPEEK